MHQFITFCNRLSNSQAILRYIHQNFFQELGICLCVGAEVEFYLSKHANNDLEQLLNDITDNLQANGISDSEIEFEKGINQFEVKLIPSYDPLTLAANIVNARKIIQEKAVFYREQAYFDAKPFPTEPGSGLHIHLSLFDLAQHNIFDKVQNEESLYLLYTIGGICAALQESMIFFAPTPSCYDRLAGKFDAPNTLSWGGNNRTVAIRIPDVKERRIEHRVASAASNPYLVIASILIAANFGLKHYIMPPPKIYGRAYDAQYNLENLAKDLQQAEAKFQSSTIIRPALEQAINFELQFLQDGSRISF
jgi:glutamine synthetase